MKMTMTKRLTKCLTVTLSTQTFLNFYQIFDKHKDKKDNQMKMKKTKRMANASLLHFPLKPSPISFRI